MVAIRTGLTDISLCRHTATDRHAVATATLSLPRIRADVHRFRVLRRTVERDRRMRIGVRPACVRAGFGGIGHIRLRGIFPGGRGGGCLTRRAGTSAVVLLVLIA